jgi:predicted dehydrogenase
VEALLADPAIEMIVNLTPASEHERLNEAVIAAGKHLYSEKPFGLSLAAVEKLVDQAARQNVLIGSAPDTFYGSAHQAARRALDSGAIGKPVFGASFVGFPGLEFFHPNPANFYLPGGEPPYDVGPYFISMWVNLLGPVKQVYAAGNRGHDRRTIRRGPQAGTEFPVEVMTSFNVVLEFDQATVNLVTSLDVVTPTVRPGDLYGSNGALSLADPIFFSGEPRIIQPDGPVAIDAADLPFSKPNRLNHGGRPVADYRGVGLIDLALALRGGKAHRTGPDLILHIVEVMESIVRSAQTHSPIAMQSSCQRPAAIDAESDAALIAMTPSPFDMDETGASAR